MQEGTSECGLNSQKNSPLLLLNVCELVFGCVVVF